MAVKTPEYSQGSQVVFNSEEFNATDVKVSYGSASSSSSSASQIDVSGLHLAAGSDRQYVAPPLNDVASATGATGVLAEVSLSFQGLYNPSRLSTGHPLDLGAVLKLKGTARCIAYDVTLAVGDIVKGTAQFEFLTIDPSYT